MGRQGEQEKPGRWERAAFHKALNASLSSQRWRQPGAVEASYFGGSGSESHGSYVETGQSARDRSPGRGSVQNPGTLAASGQLLRGAG